MKNQKNNQQKNSTINIINNFIDNKEIYDYYVENKNIYKILLKNNIDVFNDVAFLELSGSFTATKISKLIDIENNNIMIISKKNGEPVRRSWANYQDVIIYNYDALLGNPTRSNEYFNETRKEPTRSTLVVYQNKRYFNEIIVKRNNRYNDFNYYRCNLVKRLKNYDFDFYNINNEKYINIKSLFNSYNIIEYSNIKINFRNCCYSKSDLIAYNNENILKIIDKSGYLKINIINDLKNRFEKYKAEQDQKRLLKYNFDGDFKKLNNLQNDLKNILESINININIDDSYSIKLLEKINDLNIKINKLKSRFNINNYKNIEDAKKRFAECQEQYNSIAEDQKEFCYCIERYSWKKHLETPERVTKSRFNWLIEYNQKYNNRFTIATAKNGIKILLVGF